MKNFNKKFPNTKLYANLCSAMYYARVFKLLSFCYFYTWLTGCAFTVISLLIHTPPPRFFAMLQLFLPLHSPLGLLLLRAKVSKTLQNQQCPYPEIPVERAGCQKNSDRREMQIPFGACSTSKRSKCILLPFLIFHCLIIPLYFVIFRVLRARRISCGTSGMQKLCLFISTKIVERGKKKEYVKLQRFPPCYARCNFILLALIISLFFSVSILEVNCFFFP